MLSCPEIIYVRYQCNLYVVVVLTSVRFFGTFISDVTLVPDNVQMFVARQLSVEDVSVLESYTKRDNTKWEHALLIREQFGYHEFSNPPWLFCLSRLLFSRAWVSNERPTLMFDFATAWLIQQKVLLPGVTTLTRLISEVRERVAKRLWIRLSSLPTDEQKAKLETLLHVPDGEEFPSLIVIEEVL